MNRLELIGRLIKDPEIRYTKDNKKISSITLAVNNSKDDTTFFRISSFEKVADLIEKYTHKGDLIYIECIAKNYDYEDDKHVKHYEYSFIGNRIEFLSSNTNISDKQKQPEKPVKNDLDDKVFEDFGNKIEIEESELAF